jgi:hypothetical protein
MVKLISVSSLSVLAIALLTTGFNSQSVTAKTVEIQTSQHTKPTLLVQILQDISDQTLQDSSDQTLQDSSDQTLQNSGDQPSKEPNINDQQLSEDDWYGGVLIPKN